MKRYQLILIRGWWLVLFSPLLPVENWPAEPARPQPQAAAQSKWTVDDIVRAESAGSFDIAPDCRWAVWVKTAPDKDQGKDVSNLMLSSVTERKTIELTRGKESCTKPKWSPDGQLIAFLTARPNPIAKPKPDGPGEESDLKDDKKPQLWLINPFGGEPWALTDLARGIAMYGWADAETIVFAAQEEKALPELSAKEKKDTAQAVEDEPHEPPVRLFKVAVKSKKITRLSDNTDWIRQLFVAPHGRHAVTIHEQSLRHTWDQKIKPAVFLYDLRTMERKQIFTEPGFNIAALKWTPDSLGFYATSRFTTHPRYVLATVTEVYFYELEASAPRKVELGSDQGLAATASLAATTDGFVALLASGARNDAVRYTRSGGSWPRQRIEGEHAENIFELALGKDGQTLLYKHSTASKPVEWYRAKFADGRIDAPIQLTELNEHFQKKTLARSELVRWKGALNEEVEGILYYPHDYQPGRKHSLVVMIHGGPFGADFDAWEENIYISPNSMCQRGAFVLKPN